MGAFAEGAGVGRKRGAEKGVTVREYQSGRKAIRIHFSYRGVACRETLKGVKPTAANIRFADNLKATIDHEIATGTFDYLARFPHSKKARLLAGGASRVTLKSLRDEYAAEVGRRFQPATVRSYLGPLDSWVLPTFGNVPLAEIDAPMVRRALRDLDMRGLAVKSVSNYKTALNKILDYAVDEQYLDANPALAVQVARVVASKPRADQVDPLTADEIEKVIRAASDHAGAAFARYLTFALYSGLRTSELYGLRWDDVDLERGTVFVQRAVVHGKMKAMPKTDAGLRDVLLLPPALAALQGQRATSQLLGSFVWLNPRTGKGFRRYKETAGRWRRVLAKAKVRYRNQYQTRHTYASHLLSGGENPHFVARQLGHKTVEMVMRRYARWIEQAGRIEGHRWVSDYGRGGK